MRVSPYIKDFMDADQYGLDAETRQQATNTALSQMLVQKNWDRNVRHNMKEHSDIEFVSKLFGKFMDEPVVIVAAGSSFSRTPEMMDKFKVSKVICVDRALDKLQALGITPDYVVCRDASPNVAEFIKNIKEQSIAIISIMCDPSVYEVAGVCHKVYRFGPINPFNMVYNCWYQDYGKEIGCCTENELVTFSALDLAVRMGFNPIVLCGNDLCYKNKAEALAAGIPSKDIVPFDPTVYDDPEDALSGLRCLMIDVKKADTRVTINNFITPIRGFRNEAMYYPDVTFYNASGTMLGGAYPNDTTPGLWVYLQ